MVHQSKNFVQPEVSKQSPFGYMPFILSLVIGYSILFLMIILFFKVDKAKHLIFYDFDRVDPFFSTYLVFIYGFLCAGIFVHHLKTDPLYKDQVTPIEKHLPKALYIGNILLAMLPSFYWLMILLSNKPMSHIYSIIISVGMIGYLATLYFNVGPTFRKLDETKDYSSLYFNMNFFTGINRFLAFIIISMFVYFYLYYETSMLHKISRVFASVEHTEHWFKHLYFIIIIILVSGFYQLWEIIKEKMGNWFYPLLVPVMLLSLSLIAIGTIPALDIILLGAIVLRVILFEMAEIGKSLYDLFLVNKEKVSVKKRYFALSKRKKTSVFVLVGVLVIYGFYLTIDEKSKVPHYEFLQKDLEQKHTQNILLSEAITRWMKNKKDDPAPVYLIAGQGGGSRAGCAMFSVLSLLDSKPDIKNNILAITTISGSSNGASFYLASRFMGKNHIDSLENRANELYNVDYVTKSLYKLLFTDHFIYKYFVDHTFGKWFKKVRYLNRNDNLIQLESRSFDNNAKLRKLQWSDMYRDTLPELPIFMPVTYNVSKGLPGISSPYQYDVPEYKNYYSVLDQLAQKGKTITISQSVALSQMFPMISASAIVDGCNYMDGGVYDNGPYESLDNIYQLTRKIRDEIAKEKRIVLITVENGRFAATNDTITSQLTAVINSVTNSIFTSNPTIHLQEIESLKDVKDSIIRLQIYEPKVEKEKSHWLNIPKYFRIKTDTSSVVMSRYLTKGEIKYIVNKAKKEVEKVSH
ncbi:MAG: patatin-like phospholipase family protein [Saprospiraceae bacterium]|nr:patatin-like phospholipase family protein [Saprospiraceae bacterium]